MNINTNKINIFKHLDYKIYLRAEIVRNESSRGFQSRLAKAAKCQKSYFSQVLRSKYHITNEQAFRICEFLGLSNVESEYFMELVNLARTDFSKLRDRITRRLKDIRDSIDDLSLRHKPTEKLSPQQQSLYYSSWHWAAIHIAVGVSQLNTVEALVERLSLPRTIVMETLHALETMGFITPKDGGWVIKPIDLHLPRTSPLNSINHANWRNRAVLDAHNKNSQGLHYSLVMSHSFSDFEHIKEFFLNGIDQTRAIVAPSANEELTCLCVDYFKIC